MTPFYFYTLIGSLFIPALYSIAVFDFIKYWKNFIISTSVTAGLFLIWDVVFTNLGIWGFNEKYLLGYSLFLLPLEEWFFFFIIPFCSLFAHYAFCNKLPQIKSKWTIYITGVILLAFLTTVLFNSNKAYTFVNLTLAIILLCYGLVYHTLLLQQFYSTFVIILIPFLLVNGILTGSFTEEPIVWYDDSQNLGVRIFTIPVEDIAYAFSMLFGNLILFEKLNTNIK